MKNPELFKRMRDQLSELSDFSIFSKRKLLATIANQDLSEEEKKGIEAAVALILDCDCMREPDYPTRSSREFSEETKDKFFKAMDKAIGRHAA